MCVIINTTKGNNKLNSLTVGHLQGLWIIHYVNAKMAERRVSPMENTESQFKLVSGLAKLF